MRNQVVQEQEKLLGEKNKELEGLKDENKDVKESLKQRGEEVFYYKQSLLKPYIVLMINQLSLVVVCVSIYSSENI